MVDLRIAVPEIRELVLNHPVAACSVVKFRFIGLGLTSLNRQGNGSARFSTREGG